MKATAALIRSRSEPFSIEEVRIDEPRPDEVIVRIVGAGICHSDLMFQHVGDEQIPLPAIFGHEGSGVVEYVGSGVSTLVAGDHVVLTFDSCGVCASCQRGFPSYCVQFRALNASGRRPDGSTGAVDLHGAPVGNRWFGQSSFATHALATERNAVLVEADLPLELLGPLGCGLQTGAGAVLNFLHVGFASTVAVFGVGAVGMASVMAAILVGATTVISVDIHRDRLSLASELGATHTFAADDPDLEAQIRSVAPQLDFAIDTTGVPSVISVALSSLGLHGKLALLGTGTGPMLFDPSAMAGRTISFSVEGDADPHVFIPQMIRLWRHGRFPFDRLIKHYALAEVNQALADAIAGKTVKPVLLMP